MLNHWIGMGRITAPIEVKATPSGKSVTRFTIAIDRDFKGQDGEKQTDFLNVVAWEKTAEFVSRYFDKGSMICVEGSLQVRSYEDKDGNKRYVTEVRADKVHFTGEAKKAAAATTAAVPTGSFDDSDFVALDDMGDLPF